MRSACVALTAAVLALAGCQSNNDADNAERAAAAAAVQVQAAAQPQAATTGITMETASYLEVREENSGSTTVLRKDAEGRWCNDGNGRSLLASGSGRRFTLSYDEAGDFVIDLDASTAVYLGNDEPITFRLASVR
ncbi:MAG: hypothetical protein R3F55_05105 [Alphaproteobacteria bacterium]